MTRTVIIKNIPKIVKEFVWVSEFEKIKMILNAVWWTTQAKILIDWVIFYKNVYLLLHRVFIAPTLINTTKELRVKNNWVLSADIMKGMKNNDGMRKTYVDYINFLFLFFLLFILRNMKNTKNNRQTCKKIRQKILYDFYCRLIKELKIFGSIENKKFGTMKQNSYISTLKILNFLIFIIWA